MIVSPRTKHVENNTLDQAKSLIMVILTCIVSGGITSRMVLKAIASGSQLDFLLALARTGTNHMTCVIGRSRPPPALPTPSP